MTRAITPSPANSLLLTSRRAALPRCSQSLSSAEIASRASSASSTSAPSELGRPEKSSLPALPPTSPSTYSNKSIAPTFRRSRSSKSGKLFETHKLETLARMARLVAHDFNNVLAVCALTAEDATSRQCAECNDSWQGIKEAIQAGHRLSRKLLHIGLRQRDDGEPTDFRAPLEPPFGVPVFLGGARATLTIDLRESKPWVTSARGRDGTDPL